MSNIYLIQLFFCGERNRSGLIGENIMHAVIHSGEDTLKMLPFVLTVFLVLEFLEHKGSSIMDKLISKIMRNGPIFGAVTGSVPQCGFAAAAAKLWADRRISTGTLMAVFIATSDEALILLLSSPGNIKTMAAILVIKLIVAISTGYVIDRRIDPQFLCMEKEKARSRQIQSSIIKPPEYCCCVTNTDILKTVIFHTGKLILIIFLFSAMVNIVVYTAGENVISSILMSGTIFQPMITAAFGLIPSCLPSILTTQLYMDGLLSFPSLIAALTSNAGIGLLIAPSSRIAGILFMTGVLSAIICGMFLPLS